MELRQLVDTLLRRWKFIVAMLALGLVGAAVVTALMTTQYESTARLYMTTKPGPGSPAFQLSFYATQRVSSYAELADDPEVARQIIQQSDLETTPAALREQITTQAVENSPILKIVVTSDDPEDAQRIAKTAAGVITGLISDLETSVAPGAQKPTSPISPTLASAPSVNEDPVAPNMKLNLAVGGLLGLLIGVGGALLRETFDSTVRTRQDLAGLTEEGAMAVVPYDPTASQQPLADSGSQRGEAYRVLRTNMRLLDLDSDHQALVVSSAVSGEGKTLTATNLAITLAKVGHRVLLVDCDLRTPSVTRQLQLPDEEGLMTALVGDLELSQCVQRHASGVDVLGTGPLPPNPTEVLETQAFRHLLDQTRHQYDAVLIDAPPLLPVADPAIIASLVDGALLVARQGETGRDQVLQAVERLDAVGARLAGLVLNIAPTGPDYGYTAQAGRLTSFVRTRVNRLRAGNQQDEHDAEQDRVPGPADVR